MAAAGAGAAAATAATPGKVVRVLRLARFPILEQLKLEEALLRATPDNWLLLNDGAPDTTIVMGISGCVFCDLDFLLRPKLTPMARICTLAMSCNMSIMMSTLPYRSPTHGKNGAARCQSCCTRTRWRAAACPWCAALQGAAPSSLTPTPCSRHSSCRCVCGGVCCVLLLQRA